MGRGIDKIREYIANKHDHSRSFSDDDDIIENRLIDSLQFVEFIHYIEEISGISVDMEDLDIENFRTVSRIDRAFFSREPQNVELSR